MKRNEEQTPAAASAATYESRLAAIDETHRYYRTTAVVALVAGVFVSITTTVKGVWFVAPFALAIGVAIGTLLWRVASRFRPLPAELLTRGRGTPAVVLAARHVGPTLRAFGFSDRTRSQRGSEFRVEVRPEGKDPYQVVLTTFDGPRPSGLEGRPVTVYVDPADPGRIYPDWRSVAAEF